MKKLLCFLSLFLVFSFCADAQIDISQAGNFAVIKNGSTYVGSYSLPTLSIRVGQITSSDTINVVIQIANQNGTIVDQQIAATSVSVNTVLAVGYIDLKNKLASAFPYPSGGGGTGSNVAVTNFPTLYPGDSTKQKQTVYITGANLLPVDSAKERAATYIIGANKLPIDSTTTKQSVLVVGQALNTLNQLHSDLIAPLPSGSNVIGALDSTRQGKNFVVSGQSGPLQVTTIASDSTKAKQSTFITGANKLPIDSTTTGKNVVIQGVGSNPIPVSGSVSVSNEYSVQASDSIKLKQSLYIIGSNKLQVGVDSTTTGKNINIAGQTQPLQVTSLASDSTKTARNFVISGQGPLLAFDSTKQGKNVVISAQAAVLAVSPVGTTAITGQLGSVTNTTSLATTLSQEYAFGSITTQNLNSTGTATAGSALEILTVGANAVSIQITGTYTGALSIQYLNENTGQSWVTLTGNQILTMISSATGSTVASAATGMFTVPTFGSWKVRITGLAAMTGSANITLRAYQSKGADLVGLLPGQTLANITTVTTVTTVSTVTTLANGQTASGSAATGSPLRIGAIVVPTTAATQVALTPAVAYNVGLTTGQQEITKSFGTAELDYTFNGTIPSTTVIPFKNASGSTGIRNYCSEITLSGTTNAVSGTVYIEDALLTAASQTIASNTLTTSTNHDFKVDRKSVV